jgi:hypothetical protein
MRWPSWHWQAGLVGLFGYLLYFGYLLWLPLTVFALVCGFSWFLDLTAGDEARQRISASLTPRPDNHANTAAAAILTVFDLIYTLPLFLTESGRDFRRRLESTHWNPLEAWWAFASSAFIAVIVTSVLTYLDFKRSANDELFDAFLIAFLSGIAANIISDYLALFVIRRWLASDEAHPVRSVFFARLVGTLLVISFMGLRLVLFFMTISLLFNNPCYPASDGSCMTPVSADDPASSYLYKWDMATVQQMWPIVYKLHHPGVKAALVVHSWLPLFALSVRMLKWLNGALHTIRILERHVVGDNHPVLALGVVAGALATVVVLLVQLLLLNTFQWLAPLVRYLLPFQV